MDTMAFAESASGETVETAFATSFRSDVFKRRFHLSVTTTAADAFVALEVT